MDKYTYNIKAEKIQKLVKKGDYAAAVKIAETVDWEEVHSVRILTITAAAYERMRDYKGAIELLQLAYDESAVGKRILYKLTGLAIADGDATLAQKYYEMYLQEAPDENGRYLLRYLLAELKGESLDKRIAILETYRKYEFEEEWALRLAELYDEAGMGDACAKLCDEIILWFGVGKYVDQALKLKAKYAPLSAEQQDKIVNKEYYEKRYQNVAAEYKEKDEAGAEGEEAGNGEDASAAEEADAVKKPAVLPGLPGEDESWRSRIILVEGESLEKAVPKALTALTAYHEAKGTAMGGLTRIPAVKLNKLGLEVSRPHIAEKDLLVDGAAALSDELLGEILAYIKEKGTTTVFALTDTPTELAYLDVRLGAFLKKDALPSINTAEEEAVQLDVAAVLEDETKEDALGDTKEIVPQVKAALGDTQEIPAFDERTAVSDTVKFDKGAVAEEAGEDAESEAKPAAAEEKTAEAAAPEVKPAEAEAKPAETKPEAAPADEKEAVLPENDDDYRQETIEDFFRAFEGESKAAGEEIKEEVSAAASAAPIAVAAVVEKAAEAGEKQAAEEAENLRAEAKPAEEAVQEVKAAAAGLREKTEAVADKAEAVKETVSAEAETVKAAAEAEVIAAGKVLDEVLVEEEEAEDPAEALRRKAAKLHGSMSPESFLIYAKNYLTSIDCVLQEDGEEALRLAAEDRLNEGTPLTKAEAENIIEAAADLSEKKGGLFARRYNKEGCLILKSKYIV